MPPEMRTPPPVDLSSWVDRVDRRLGREVTPRGRLRGSLPGVSDKIMRVVRSLARPVAHGSVSVVAAIVVVATVAPPLAEDVTPAVSEIAGQEAEIIELEPATVSFPRPARPPLHRLLVPEDAAAAVEAHDIQTAREELTGTPHGDDRAVPTPDGGGPARAALRPTVR